jgi:hypothetical protein
MSKYTHVFNVILDIKNKNILKHYIPGIWIYVLQCFLLCETSGNGSPGCDVGRALFLPYDGTAWVKANGAHIFFSWWEPDYFFQNGYGADFFF